MQRQSRISATVIAGPEAADPPEVAPESCTSCSTAGCGRVDWADWQAGPSAREARGATATARTRTVPATAATRRGESLWLMIGIFLR